MLGPDSEDEKVICEAFKKLEHAVDDAPLETTERLYFLLHSFEYEVMNRCNKIPVYMVFDNI